MEDSFTWSGQLVILSYGDHTPQCTKALCTEFVDEKVKYLYLTYVKTLHTARLHTDTLELAERWTYPISSVTSPFREEQ
jgi:hypothetical protein